MVELTINVNDNVQAAEQAEGLYQASGQIPGRNLPALTAEHLKKSAVEMLSRQVMSRGKLAEQLGISRTTLWFMAKQDPAFARAMDEAQHAQDHMRNDAVENTWLQRLIKGEATELGYIFYLCNRMPERWKDKRALINNNIVVPQAEDGIEGVRQMVKAWTPEQRRLFLNTIGPVAKQLTIDVKAEEVHEPSH